METFETLDDDIFDETEVSETIQKESTTISIWIKIIAIIGIAGAVIPIIISIVYGNDIIGTIFSSGITIALNATLLIYGNKLFAFSKSGSERDFSLAMTAQKSYWMFIGILLIIVLALMILLFIVAGAEYGQLIEQMMNR